MENNKNIDWLFGFLIDALLSFDFANAFHGLMLILESGQSLILDEVYKISLANNLALKRGSPEWDDMFQNYLMILKWIF